MFFRQFEMVQDLIDQFVVPVFIESLSEPNDLADRHPGIERMSFRHVGDPRTSRWGHRRDLVAQ